MRGAGKAIDLGCFFGGGLFSLPDAFVLRGRKNKGFGTKSMAVIVHKNVERLQFEQHCYI